MDLDPELYAGFLGSGPQATRTWRTDQPEEMRAANEAGDGKSHKFVLYSGNEVRFHPVWQDGGDLIETKEFRLGPFRSNPRVLADHDPHHVIGRGTAQIVQGGESTQLHGEVVWDLHESNPLAILIAGQHQRGMRGAVSIGFMPGKGSGPRTKLAADHPAYMDPEKVPAWRAGWYMRFPELYEWSSVSIPKDRGALQLQAQLQAWAMEAEDPDERVRRLVREELDKYGADIVLRAYAADERLRAKITASVLAELPAPDTHIPAPAAPSDWWEDWT
jgi:hypothetical protein